MSDRHIARIEVHGRPATFATTSEVAWKAAVRAAVEQSGCKPPDEARFAVRIDFRLAEAKTTGGETGEEQYRQQNQQAHGARRQQPGHQSQEHPEQTLQVATD